MRLELRDWGDIFFPSLHFKPCALENCLQILELVGERSDRQREIKAKVTSSIDRQIMVLAS